MTLIGGTTEEAPQAYKDINSVMESAHERLMMKLSSIEEQKQMEQTHSVWMNHNTLERGNPIKKIKGDL